MRAALDRRDPAYDGVFVYGVVSTGVFCRPICASRRPRPENVRFFEEPAAARAAGFRPCKRCAPDAPTDTGRMAAIARHIAAHADAPLPLADLAARAGLSPTHFQRVFTAAFGVSPHAFQQAARRDRLKAGLRAGDSVAAAGYAAGYGAPSRLYAGARMGMTPGAYRAGGAGETICYTCRDCALGPLLMAATDAGVCAVLFGEDEAGLLRQLTAEFPAATLDRADEAPLEDWMAALDAHLSAGGPRPDLPLDLRGTAFQIRVWRFLTQIPEGETRSYAQVAQAIGQAGAARAAGSACGRNRIGVLVPCHRVLRGDGGIGGYRWGEARKRALLAAEGVACHPRVDSRTPAR